MPDIPKIFPLGDRALTIDFGNEISIETNDRAIALCAHFESVSFPGFIEAVPAYSSAAIFYEPLAVRRSFSTFANAFEAISDLVRSALQQMPTAPEIVVRHFDVPVDFKSDAALDLPSILNDKRMRHDEFVEIFTSRTYRVYMLGFLPGFAYMGEVDERIAAPRKRSPRLKVPKGSVGIAGRQTGIYPLESPGGWQIIGRTHPAMFTPNSDDPCLMRAGDTVKFVSLR